MTVRDSPLRYGFVGTGCRGQDHIRIADQTPGVEVAAIADPWPDSVKQALALCSEPNRVRVYEDYRELFDDSNLDAVFIATPNHMHVDVVRIAMQHDKAVFVEKPLAHRPEDASLIQAMAADFAPLFWVGLQYRYMPAIAQMRSEVERGAVGSPVMLAIRERRGPFLDKVDNWNRFTRFSGGTLIEKCCHFFDLFNLLSRSRPTRIFASGGMDVDYKEETYRLGRPDILDNAYVTVEYRSGARANLELCMFHPSAQTHPEMALSVTGDTGYIEVELPSSRVIMENFRTGETRTLCIEGSPTALAGHYGSDVAVHLAFADCLRRGTRPEVQIEDAALSVYLGAAAELSARDGRVVDIDEVMGDVERTGTTSTGG